MNGALDMPLKLRHPSLQLFNLLGEKIMATPDNHYALPSMILKNMHLIQGGD